MRGAITQMVHKFEWDGGSSKPKINSQALKISLGYTF